MFRKIITYFKTLKVSDTDIVLAIVHRQFHDNSKIGGEMEVSTERTIAEDRALIAKYRGWLRTQPRNVIGAYEHWLRYYENGCDEAEKAIAGNTRRKFRDRWKKISAKLDAAAERGKTYPKLDI